MDVVVTNFLPNFICTSATTSTLPLTSISFIVMHTFHEIFLFFLLRIVQLCPSKARLFYSQKTSTLTSRHGKWGIS